MGGLPSKGDMRNEGDWRVGYYRDQTFAWATGMSGHAS